MGTELRSGTRSLAPDEHLVSVLSGRYNAVIRQHGTGDSKDVVKHAMLLTLPLVSLLVGHVIVSCQSSSGG